MVTPWPVQGAVPYDADLKSYIDSLFESGNDRIARPFSYYVWREGNTYFAMDSGGTIVSAVADTATTSGLKAVLTAILPQGTANKTVHFASDTRFHFLDAPLGNESWAGVEDHFSFVSLRDISLVGGGWGTIISNRTNWSGATDTEPLSFTSSQGIHVKDLQIESCGSAKSTTGGIDFDQGVDCHVDHVRILRTRGAQALIFDGGDAGKYGGRNRAMGTLVQGRPQPPQLSLVPGGSLAATTEYRYCVTWTDQDLAGVNTPDETMPSDVTRITTTSSRIVRMTIQRGPYTCTARNVYRWDATNGWRLIAVIPNNTDQSFDDDGSTTPSAATFAKRSTIMGSGFEFMGCHDSVFEACVADGCGDVVVGVNQYAFNITRKALNPSNGNRIIGCFANMSGLHAYRIGGGSDNIISSSHARNPGTPSVKGQFVRIEGIAGILTNRNIVFGMRGVDDQTSESPFGGGSTSNPYAVTSTNAPTNNQIAICTFTGHASAPSDLGTGTVVTAVTLT